MPRAPRQCPAREGCDNLITGSQRYCADHTQSWAGPRTASSRLHGDKRWKPFRAGILERDGFQCQIQYRGICTGTATTVDLIEPAARRPDLAFTADNARAACRPCNEHKGRTEDRTQP